MIKVDIQIEDGLIEDSLSRWGLIYQGSDNRFAPPEKKPLESSYVHESGAHIDPRVTYDAFDHTFKFVILCPNSDITNANAVVKAFNSAIRKESKGTQRRMRKIAIYDYYKRVKIVGYPSLIEQPTELYRRMDGKQEDCALVELKIRVVNPSACDFNLKSDEKIGWIDLSLSTDGKALMLNTSRQLEPNEYPIVLFRGSQKCQIRRTNVWRKSRYRWHVARLSSTQDQIYRLNGGALEYYDVEKRKYIPITERLKWYVEHRNSGPIIRIKKSKNSKSFLPAIVGRDAEVTYGVAIYRENGASQRRVSKVCYFRKWATVTGMNGENPEFEQKIMV